MNSFRLLLCTLAIMLSANVFSDGVIASDPGKSYPGFKSYELPFVIQKGKKFGYKHMSVKFYAIILKSVTACAETEKDRKNIQLLFPSNKVFTSRLGCDFENMIYYTNINNKFQIIAVYGGKTLKQAKAFLKKVKATGKFPGANIRKMQVGQEIT